MYEVVIVFVKFSIASQREKAVSESVCMHTLGDVCLLGMMFVFFKRKKSANRSLLQNDFLLFVL